MGTEHLLVMMMDKVLSLLDEPGMSAVVFGAVNWSGAFDRQDPTITIMKMIKMRVRSSIIMIIMEFLEDKEMSAKFNSAKSKWYKLIGGALQGSWNGQNCYIVNSDDNAYCIDQDEKYKFCDDLSILELIMIGGSLT